MIIIEGPDGAGKTTLARRLHQDLNEKGLEVGLNISTGDVPKDPVQKMMDAIQGLFKWQHDPKHHRPVIYDRLIFSEFIYGPILRGNLVPGINAQSLTAITKLIASQQVPVIMCLPPFESVQAKVANSDQLEGVNDRIERIYNGYESLFVALAEEPDEYRLPLFLHDYTYLGEESKWTNAGQLGFSVNPPYVDKFDWLTTSYNDLFKSMCAYISSVDRSPQGELPASTAKDQLIDLIANGQVEVVHMSTQDKTDNDKKDTLL